MMDESQRQIQSQSPASDSTPRLGTGGRVRVVLVGIVLPFALVLVTWVVTSSWNDLPEKFPSHWGTGGADSFVPPQAYIDMQITAGIIAAAITASVAIGSAWGSRWSPLGRGFSAVGVGVTAAIVLGLLVQMFRSRGLSTEEVVALGAGAGIFGVLGGFVVFIVAALLALPKGIHAPL